MPLMIRREILERYRNIIAGADEYHEDVVHEAIHRVSKQLGRADERDDFKKHIQRTVSNYEQCKRELNACRRWKPDAIGRSVIETCERAIRDDIYARPYDATFVMLVRNTAGRLEREYEKRIKER